MADFFCGSGTTTAVAEKPGRKWIVGNLGKFPVHTTRKRMIGVQRQRLAEKEAAFLDLILRACRAEKPDGFETFHGKKSRTSGRHRPCQPAGHAAVGKRSPWKRQFPVEVICE
ncbi:MAG: hypothetical protein KDA89_20745 [Planctomycetaceae bacterium]|nr:hypothetical protein [Planctomycetaceae bacterium]